MAQVFQTQKQKALSGIDLSRKGSIDEGILHLVARINAQDNFFTLSSCSGRICVFEEVKFQLIWAAETAYLHNFRE